MIPSSLTALLQELIRIPSVNPDGFPGTTEVGELRIANYLGDLLKHLGADVEYQEVHPGRPNVVARFPSATPGKPRLLFAPHTDTVSVAGMTIAPFGGELRDKRIWGRGASDTKGSIASMLWAIKESRKILSDLPYEIWFAGLMGEEAGLLGSKALAKRMKFDFVIVGEPTGLNIVHTTKGSTWLSIRTTGRASHAANPEQGINAIDAMADVIRCIRDEIAPKLKALRYPVLGSPTISVGTIHGGSKTNIVPDVCEISVDMRTIPDQETDSIFARIREVAPGVEISSWASKPMFTSPYHAVIRTMQECGAQCIGAPWFCDAASFAEFRMPAVAVGPGSIDQAHTKDEFLAVADLDAGARFFSSFLRKLKAG